MGWKIFFSFIFILFAVGLLTFYWFIPFGTNEFVTTQISSNFSFTNSSLQFYPNMRFPDSQISYKISDCPIQKKDEMKRALDIVSKKTLLTFYPVSLNEEITVTCDDNVKNEGGLFIAGEGGPTNITVADGYNIITHGKVLLIKPALCPNPNVALHELLHALGFDHSENENNVMYPISNCDQTIGEDVIELIDRLYSVPSLPDLAIENTSAIMHGNYLDLNISLRNNGFVDAPKSKIFIYADDKNIKTVDMEEIELGRGRGIAFTNLWLKTRNVRQIKIMIETDFEELDQTNNIVVLVLKS
ncbi:MAG: matrixin family metalloprotease [Candidatus Pacearchaeota archaeon]